MLVLSVDVNSGAGTQVLQTADTVFLVGTVDMSAADYALFGSNNFSTIGA